MLGRISSGLAEEFASLAEVLLGEGRQGEPVEVPFVLLNLGHPLVDLFFGFLWRETVLGRPIFDHRTEVDRFRSLLLDLEPRLKLGLLGCALDKGLDEFISPELLGPFRQQPDR